MVLPPLREGLLRSPPRVPSELVPVLEAQSEARRRLVSESRGFLRTATQLSTELLHAERRARAGAVRAEWDEETGKAIIKSFNRNLRGVPPATDRDIVALSRTLNKAMCHLYPQARSQVAFFLLFRHMDEDASGLISYKELHSMIRNLLKVSSDELSDRELQSMWRWIDDDESGMIGSGEFTRLMRRGWGAFVEERKRLERNGDRPPGWTPVAAAMPLESTWGQLHEPEGRYLRVARVVAMENASQLEQEARRLGKAKRDLLKRLHSLPVRPSTVGTMTGSALGASEPKSIGLGHGLGNARGSMRGSASAPSLT